jgi:hypothetical protein
LSNGTCKRARGKGEERVKEEREGWEGSEPIPSFSSRRFAASGRIDVDRNRRDGYVLAFGGEGKIFVPLRVE